MSDSPNFLFLFPDQWRWDFLGCETSPFGRMPVCTPHVDQLAQRGVRFTQCRTNSPLCAPARAALSQGVRYHRCGVANNGQDTPHDAATFFTLLRAAGYRTMTCGKNDLHKHTHWKGRDGWTRLLGQYGFTDAIDQSGKYDAAGHGRVEQGGPHCSYTSYLHAHGLFEVYREACRRKEQWGQFASPLAREHYTDDFCGRMALELLRRTPAEGPWALWVNFPGPHDPFDPPAELQRRYDGVTFPDPVCNAKVGTAEGAGLQQIRRNYAACCEGIDQWVGWIIDAVAQRGELENTVVIFASDHGEMLGDHERFTKMVPHEPSVHVPLVIAGPGIKGGRVSQALVELIDLAATHLDLAGLPIPRYFDSRSLAPILTGRAGDASHREVIVSGLESWRSACDGRHKLVEVDGTDDTVAAALYDLERDPGETVDVSRRKPKVAARLAAYLAEHCGSTFAPPLGKSPARRR